MGPASPACAGGHRKKTGYNAHVTGHGLLPGKDWRVTMEAQDERSVPNNITPNPGALTGLRIIELADEQA